MKNRFNIAIVGATGLVGRTMLKVLAERNFPIDNLYLFASAKSSGTEIGYDNRIITVRDIAEADFKEMDIALFSAGKEVSINYAPKAALQGCVVIDNGSYWRMNQYVPLVVPEVNPEAVNIHRGIIANPNCSTIQLVAALKPLHDKFRLRRIIVSTYQSISGAGQKGIDKLNAELSDPELSIGKHRIASNLIFHEFGNNGFTVEEIKMINETRKILSEPELPIAVTCVRVPTLGGHGESVNIELESPFSLVEAHQLLKNQQSIIIVDNLKEELYPTPELSNGTDAVYVGRLRRDSTVENGLYMWIVSDNLRKGAATNAIQIAELIIAQQKLNFKPEDSSVFL